MATPYKHRINFNFDNFGIAPYYAIANEITEWVNVCFDTNTNRYFSLGNLKLGVKEVPTAGSAYILPPKKFKLDVYIHNSSTGGYCLFNEKGDSIIVVSTPKLQVNLQLKNNILHEIGHAFGMAIGEYYKIRNIVDLTRVEPALKVSTIVKDHYWSQKPEWLNDVMLNVAAKYPKWSPLSALVANHGYWRAAGPPLPDLESIRVQSLFPDCNFYVYRMCSVGFEKLQEGKTDMHGCFDFSWGGDKYVEPSFAISEDQFRKIVFIDSKSQNHARGLSIFDVQYAWLKECETNKVISENPPNLAYMVNL